MKKILVLIIIVLIANFAVGQKLDVKDVPAAVTSSFNKLYPAVKDVKWGKEDADFEAEFDLNKIETSATFDSKGNLKEVESEIEVSALPQKVRDYVLKNYPDHKIKEASKIIDAKGIVTYEAEMKGMEVIFDSSGTFLKEIKQVVKEKKD